MKKYTNTGSKDTRSGFGAGMTELGQKNENVVALCADLIGSLKFDDFKKMAKNPKLSGAEKIGFPDSYRKGKSKLILEDICTKLLLTKTKNKIIVDIGCGCDELTFELIDICKKNNHTIVLIDSEEMLKQLQLWDKL